MKTNQACPNCGKPLPEGALAGLCPACLMAAGTRADSGPDPGEALGETVVSPSASAGLSPARLPTAGENFGPYRIRRRLGEGGMGVVFEAEELDSGRRVALKVINQKLRSPPDRARFLREGRLAASINHPNCVYVFGTAEIDETPVIAMEFVGGHTLQQRLAQEGPLPVGQAVDAILQVLDGLEAAHELGILHRDIKPSNCFEDDRGTVKIGDFGLSVSTLPRLQTQITEAGAMMGTPAFCSPEQLRGEELNARSDMYGVGVTLYQLLTGRLPFEGATLAQVIANTLERRPTSPRQYRPDLPNGLVRIVLRCLEKQPGERYRSHEDLRRALQPYGSRAPTPATVGLRFVAGLLDFAVLNVVSQAVVLGLVGDPFARLDQWARHPWRGLLVVLSCLGLVILYYALCEWRWGATPGKALCRLRVWQSDRNFPSLRRALLRSALFMVVPALPVWTLILITGDPLTLADRSPRSLAANLAWYVLLVLLFVTARRRNGFAAIHDLASQTRVVSRVAWAARPIIEPSEKQPEGVESKPAIGPYHWLRSLGVAGEAEWAEGYDLRLLRRVLLRIVQPGTPPLPAPVQRIARPGRFRWLAGRRDETENWDAFESAGGQPLRTLAEHVQPWSKVRFWLRDLAVELAEAERDGSLPARLDPDQVWITRDGRAKLFDYPLPDAPGTGYAAMPAGGAVEATPAGPSIATVFLRRIAALGLGGRSWEGREAASVPAAIPIHARRFLVALSSTKSVAELATVLGELLQRTPGVTRRRRATITMAAVALPLVMSAAVITAGSVMQGWQAKNPELIELAGVLNTWRTKHLPFVPADRLSADRLFGIFIASHYRGLITNQEIWSGTLARSLIPQDARRFAEGSLDLQPPPEPRELQEAEQRLKPVADQTQASWQTAPRAFGSMILWSCLLLYAAIPSVIAALLFRGGVVLWIAGVTFVRRDGRLASRARLFWRSLVAWSPLGAAAAVGLATASTVSFWTGVAGAGVLVLLTSWSLGLPDRGLPDRLAGTWPVPR